MKHQCPFRFSGISVLVWGVLLLVVLFSTGCSAGVDSYREEQELNVSAEEIDTFEIFAGLGSLDITVSEESNGITVYAEIITGAADREAAEFRMEKELLLTLKRKGNRAVLDCGFYGMFSFLGIHQGRAVNLDIRVPPGMAIHVNNPEGEIHTAGLENSLVITNTGGDVKIQKLKGDLRVENKKGNVRIEGTEGEIRLIDNRGDIYLESIRGEVNIDDRGGDIRAAAINGNMVIADGGGSILVEGLSGNLTVTGAGKGDCTYIDVKGRIDQNR